MRKLHFKETKAAAVTIMLVAAMCSALIDAVAGSAYAQSSATPTERFVLSGVVFVEDGKGLAWLQEPTLTNNRIISVRPGDSIGPYRVTRILEDQVVLDGPGGTVSIPLAGGPGTATAAVDLRTPQVPAPDKPPTVPMIVIPPGDPRRQFPASLILIGAGARITGAVASRASEPQTPEPQAMPSSAAVPNRASTEEAIAPYVPAHELPPHRGLNNPNMIVIPRGDPRREFPAADFLLGAR